MYEVLLACIHLYYVKTLISESDLYFFTIQTKVMNNINYNMNEQCAMT